MAVLGTFISAVTDFQVDKVVQLDCLQGVALHGRLQAPLGGEAAVVRTHGLRLHWHRRKSERTTTDKELSYDKAFAWGAVFADWTSYQVPVKFLKYL